MIGLNNKKIGFIVDSSSNLKNGQFDDVMVVPLGVSTQVGSDVKVFEDGVNFQPEDLAKALSSADITIKTSQATMPNMFKAAETMCGKYDEVFVFPIHKSLSGNVNSWQLVKQDFPHLHVVMTYDIGYSFAWTIKEVKNFLVNHTADEANVQHFVNESVVPNRVGFLMVENLDQLVKGGRIGAFKAAVAKLFKIKPVVLFNKNGLTNYDKTRDYQGLFEILDTCIKDNYDNRSIARVILFVPYGDDQTKNEYVQLYRQHYGSIPYEIVNFPTVVVGHTGLQHVAIYVELK